MSERGQRWRDGRPCFPGREVMATGSLEVAAIADDRTPKAFVIQHHYSRTRFGLWRGAELVGVAVFSHPVQNAVLDILPCDRDAAVELGRFVLLEDVAANAESWFLARAFDLMRAEGYAGIVSFSDPLPRRTAAGVVIMGGHVGTIYQATSAVYTGRGRARYLWLLPDGRTYNERAIAKVRSGARGWRYAADQLIAAGAAPLEGDRAAWLARELPRVCRRVRHRGNHRYLWGLDRATRRALSRHLEARRVKPLPYPKQVDVP